MNHEPAHPRFPERVCWGCDRHCPAHDLACGDDKARARHPSELCEDWFEGDTEQSQLEHRSPT